MHEWSPTSWQAFSYQQAAVYPDPAHLQRMVQELHRRQPLVKVAAIDQLKKEIAAAGRGEAFVLQAGDCAESFQDCHPAVIRNKLKIILQMSEILSQGLQMPVVQLGRMAGQYAKPRSSDFETVGALTLPSYRGDLINLPQFTASCRFPDPERLLEAYACSALTIDCIAGFLKTDLNPLLQPDRLAYDFILHAEKDQAKLRFFKSLCRSIASNTGHSRAPEFAFYTSHEALHLDYEQALTHVCPLSGAYYNQSAHLPWIGMRTCRINSAHVEFARGIQNPIGLKIGPATCLESLQTIIKMLNPKREAGRLLLITRFGDKQIRLRLPPIIQAVTALKIPVTWSSDPMHGNTEMTKNGIKTRHFDTILSELQQAIGIHQRLDTHLGGVHLELTGEDVTECIGGARGLEEKDLERAYQTLVDPRLNYEQSLEMALQLSYALNKGVLEQAHLQNQPIKTACKNSGILLSSQ